MDDGSILSVLIILALLLFADYFAVCETSFAAVSRIRLKTAMERGDRRANKAMYVCEHFDKAITTILIGTNIVHLSCASYVTVLVTRRWGLSAVTLSTAREQPNSRSYRHSRMPSTITAGTMKHRGDRAVYT